MSMLTFLNLTPLSERILDDATRSPRPGAQGTAIRYADELLAAMIPLHNGHRWVAEEVTADLEHVPAAVTGAMIAHLAGLTEFALLHPAVGWDGARLTDALDLASETEVIAAGQRPALVEWIADLLWEAGTAEGLCVYAFEDATPDQVRIGLAAAWATLLSTADPEQVTEWYWQHCADLANQTPDLLVPGTATAAPGVAPLAPVATARHRHRVMTGPAPVLPLLQPGARDTKILTNFHLDPRDEDAQAHAAFEYAHLALGRLLITSPEYIPDTIRATHSDLFRMPPHALECVRGELDAITAHVLHLMQDQRTLVPLNTGVTEAISRGLIDNTEAPALINWLAELHWRGDRAIPGEPATRDELLALARTALAGAATVLHTLPDPLTGLSDYHNYLADA